jgi:hypothetical protein
MFRFFLYQRKQATMQWLQDPNQSNVDNLNNVKHEASRYFKNKKENIGKLEVIMWGYGLDQSCSRQGAGTCECGNEPSGSIQCGEFFD